MKAFEANRDDHIAVYGPDNHMRLTGKHETAPWNKFSYGVADRGASIRVPHSFVNNGYKGYLEDRRPNSQGDPYQIASQILKTIASVPTAKAGRGLTSTKPRNTTGAPSGRPFCFRVISKDDGGQRGGDAGGGRETLAAIAPRPIDAGGAAFRDQGGVELGRLTNRRRPSRRPARCR